MSEAMPIVILKDHIISWADRCQSVTAATEAWLFAVGGIDIFHGTGYGIA
jgi:hypothetical protein